MVMLYLRRYCLYLLTLGLRFLLFSFLLFFSLSLSLSPHARTHMKSRTRRAGSDSSERIASQLQGPQHRHLLSAKLASEGAAAALEAAGGVALEPRLKSEHNPEGIYIHGGGTLACTRALSLVLSLSLSRAGWRVRCPPFLSFFSEVC